MISGVQMNQVFKDVASIHNQVTSHGQIPHRPQSRPSAHRSNRADRGKLHGLIRELKSLKADIHELWDYPEYRRRLVGLAQRLIEIADTLSDPKDYPPVRNRVSYFLLDKTVSGILGRSMFSKTGFSFPTKPKGMSWSDYLTLCAVRVEASEFAHAIFDQQDKELINSDISSDFYEAIMQSPIYQQANST